MSGTNYFRFACVLLLWCALVYLLLTRVEQVTAMTLFTIVASGIIVFVPLYKKYVLNKDDKQNDERR